MSILWKNAQQSIQSYFLDRDKKSELVNPLDICGDGKLLFHWANWKDSCAFQKSEVVRNRQARDKLHFLWEELDKYKEISVWLSSKDRLVESNLFDLYTAYLDPRVRISWFGKDEEMLISMANSSGPYIALSSMRWFSKTIYRSFVYHKILTERMRLRSFRLGVDIPVKLTFDKYNMNSTDLRIKQLSETGILFLINERSSFIRLMASPYLRVELTEESFVNFASLVPNFNKFVHLGNIQAKSEMISSSFLDTTIFNRYNNIINMKTSLVGGEFYFFARYEDLSMENGKFSLERLLRPLLIEIKYEFDSGLKKVA